MEKMLGGLSLEAREEFAAQFNGGLGSGMSPEEYRKYVQSISGGEPDINGSLNIKDKLKNELIYESICGKLYLYNQ